MYYYSIKQFYLLIFLHALFSKWNSRVRETGDRMRWQIINGHYTRP